MWAKEKQSGFTIVELLIVIVVIAILAAITVVAFNGVQQRGRDAQRSSDLSALQKLIELYYADRGGYPICGSANPYIPGGAFSYNTVNSCLTAALVPAYAPRLPQDPTNTGSYQYYYAVGFRKTGATSYTGDLSDNYMLGNKKETISGPNYTGWGPTDMNVLIGSAH